MSNQSIIGLNQLKKERRCVMKNCCQKLQRVRSGYAFLFTKKLKRISSTLLRISLKEIALKVYLCTFHALAERYWKSIRESSVLKKEMTYREYTTAKT